MLAMALHSARRCFPNWWGHWCGCIRADLSSIPNIADRDRPWAGTSGGGNLKLQPETATTYSFGVDYQPIRDAKFSLNYF